MLLNALKVAAQGSRWISYSRNHNFYDARRRWYHGPTFTHANVTHAVDQAAQLGLIEHQVAERGALGRQSRFRATAKLISEIAHPDARHQPHRLIRLKDDKGRLIAYRDSNVTYRMQREMAEINDAIARTTIALDSPKALHEGPIIRVDKAVLYPEMTSQWRVFSRGSFAKHGRVYGGWWQNVPKDIRPSLVIEGEPVCELDYSAHHCRMCYVLADALVPDGDPYLIPGWDTKEGRKLCKRAFVILINAPTEKAALSALAMEIEGSKCTHTESRMKAAAVIEAVRSHHEALGRFFCSDAAMTLMRYDSDMAIRVVRSLLTRRIAALAIHDSFIVQQRYKGDLSEVMEEAWAAFCSGRLSTAFQRDSRKQSYIRDPVPVCRVSPSPSLVSSVLAA